jgi:Sec-independent protein translocase protein TatA
MLPGIGLPELLLIGVVALLVLQPGDLPKFMHKLGVWSSMLRHNMSGLWAGLQEEIPQEPLSKNPPKA